ncbi:hypothetical protein ACFE33_02930 [Falsihalocynthiibacter sp. SS001]|uniref:hypothetical protein n=1 Tax=Falsihalocynthiibacter sp. SS001 TaxID=3349698 RepID=UPI0036D227C2
MTRVIVHAGFYKTGTTSLQRYFERNAHRLDGVHYFKKDAFSDSAVAARMYALRPFIWRRLSFRRAFERALETLPDTQIIILSREQFSGVMPGSRTIWRRRVTDFRTAGIPLAREISRALKRRFGPETEIEFLYTLRDGESWVHSVYRHQLRSRKLTESFKPFRKTFPTTIDLRQQADDIAKAARATSVHFSTLEDTASSKFGPATALLGLLDLDESTLNELPRARLENEGLSEELTVQFQDLNKSSLRKSELKSAKKALIQARNT